MRNFQHRPPPTSVFTSKHFVVALCAAIAMVLGVMSVGTNAPSDYEEPVVTAPNSVANRAGTLIQDSTGNNQYQAEATKPLAPLYFNHQTPVPLNSGSSSSSLPLANSPSKNLEIKLNLKPSEASVSIPSAVLLLEPDDPELNTTVPASVPTAAEPSLQNASTLTEDVLFQATEPKSENILDTSAP